MTRASKAPGPGPESWARVQASLALWLVNVLLGVLIGTAYLRHLPDGLSARAWVFVGFGLLSSVATLALVPAGVSWASLRFLQGWRVQAWIQAACGAAFLSAMKVDTVVYALLRYHFFSSAVFNVAITPGSSDAIHLGSAVWLPVALVLVLLTSAEFLLWRHLYRRYREAARASRGGVGAPRAVAVWAFLLLMVVGVEKSLYAAADIRGDRELTHASDVLPAYPALRVSHLLPDALQGLPTEVIGLDVPEKGAPLAYPLRWPEVDPRGPRPNVVVLVIDSWRRDAFDPTVTPRLSELSLEGRRFEDHHAGGNGTRFGIFSMLYGLHGTYWFSVLEEERPPVLLDVLQEEGYDLRVFSSASMNFPEFRDCAWVECIDQVRDEYPQEEPCDKDLAVAADFERFLRGREERRAAGGTPPPFFGFILLDAAHQPYSYPGEGPFQPAADHIDYMELSRDRSPELVERVHNRYLNSVHFADGVAAELVEVLRSSGELEESLVVVTGDHGEEFQENGYWGHTSNFSPEQIDVPLFLLGAGVEPGVEGRTTSHLDLPATVLELLGADPAMRRDWTLGESLLDPPRERDVVVAGWDHVGLLTPDQVFRVRVGARSATDVSVYDDGWRPHNDAAARIERHAAALGELSDECRRFLAELEAY